MSIYFMGICGTAMGQAALLLRALGHEVRGADTGTYPPMSDLLAEAGIEVLEGWDAARLERLAPELVVVGNAQSRGHPEVEWLLETRALPYTSLPALLHDRVLARRRPLVVAGTHGKTTTTALAAHLLRAAGRDPGWLVGGVTRQPPGGAAPGHDGGPFVIEGDEYDAAFFDKRSKFIHYAPRVAAVGNLEFDHADIFRDLEDYRRTFAHFLRLVPRGGAVVANGDDPEVEALVRAVTWAPVVRVGTGPACDVRIEGFAEGPDGASFALTWGGRRWAEVAWALPGLFNARNAAVAATGAALVAGETGPEGLPLDALGSFTGVRRRQDVRVARPGLVVVEDFGHHPGAIAATLTALRARHPGAEIWAALEARSNTLRRRLLQEPLTASLAGADRVWLGPVHRAGQLAESERLDPAAVAAGLRAAGRRAEACPDNAALLASVRAALADPGRPAAVVVVCFTNGSFDGVIEALAG